MTRLACVRITALTRCEIHGHAFTHTLVALEDVELLLATLRRKLLTFAPTADRDARVAAARLGALGEGSNSGGGGGAPDGAAGGGDDDGERAARVIFIARYRDGQRRVLEDGVKALEEMLEQFAQAADDEDDEDEDDEEDGGDGGGDLGAIEEGDKEEDADDSGEE